MNPQRKLILEGERHLAEKKAWIQKIEEVRNLSDPGVDVLLDIKKSELTEAVATINARLEKLQKEFVQSFEAESAEVNQKLGGVLMLASQLAGKEPVAITDQIAVLAEKLKTVEDQEEKNDMFYAMMQHINFIKTKIK